MAALGFKATALCFAALRLTAGADPDDGSCAAVSERVARENSLLQVSVASRNLQARRARSGQGEVANAAPCFAPCEHDEELYTCKSRVLWFVGREDSGNLSDALAAVNTECSGQCSCTESDFPELAGASENCWSKCDHDTDDHTCRSRVLWALSSGTSQDLPAALDVVNEECAGQCGCTGYDFPVLPHNIFSPSVDLRPCKTAVEGDKCHTAVKWAMTEGIQRHPEWYGGLTVGTSFKEFQEYLSWHGLEECQRPCDMCYTAVPGDACYDAVLVVLDRRNQSQSNLSAFEDAQAFLNTTEEGSFCPTPCQWCQVKPWERCSNGVKWAMEHGISLHPEWYPGLTSESSFDEFQKHLHEAKLEACPLPCSI